VILLNFKIGRPAEVSALERPAATGSDRVVPQRSGLDEQQRMNVTIEME
jgi:hypothetical protein